MRDRNNQKAYRYAAKCLARFAACFLLLLHTDKNQRRMDQQPHDANAPDASFELATGASDNAKASATVNPAELAAALNAIARGWDRDSLLWASGYLAGLAGAHASRADKPTAAANTDVQTQLSIVYGSQTGNSKQVAQQLAALCDQRGLKQRLVNAKDLTIKTLRKETQLVIAISTQGDGDPPDDARGFVEDLLSARAPKLPDLKYAVFALGDSSYSKFCETGKQIDERLQALGATRLIARVDADVDFQTPAQQWISALMDKLSTKPAPAALKTFPTAGAVAHARSATTKLLLKQRITAPQSTKEIYHLEFDLGETGLQYLPGDSLAIKPHNPASAVSQALGALQLSGEEPVTFANATHDLQFVLREHAEITRVHPALLQFWATHSASFSQRLSASSISELMPQLQLTELALRYPIKVTAQTLVDQLKPLKPREYSIASAQDAVGDEVHITVTRVREERDGIDYLGAGSDFLAQIQSEQTLELSVVSNPRFRLPDDSKRDVIMVGPGTGIAPFRAFVQQRSTTDAAQRGRNWLFFGNPHFRYDFLYQLEWQKALQDGSLSRLSVAFSRDQAEKRYVQHAMLENAAELYQWLQNGAHFYVCGDAKRMAKDVELALLTILAHRGDLQGSADSEFGAHKLRELQDAGRYQRDVY
jgi:sulfite reductase (NADPH) flavoprotein alpha-component